jgi:hypothetical protein
MENRGRGRARGGLKRKPGGLDSVAADEPVGVSLERGPNKHPRSAEAVSAETCAGALGSHGNVEEPSLSIIIEASAVSFQVLDDNDNLLDDEAVSESKSKCAGDKESRGHNQKNCQETLFGGSMPLQPTCKAAGSDSRLDLMTSFEKDDVVVFNTRLIEGAIKRIAPVVPSQSGVCCLLAAISFDAKLLESFGVCDHKTLSVLEDFFSTTIQHGDDDVARGLMNLAVGMRQAVYAYSKAVDKLITTAAVEPIPPPVAGARPSPTAAGKSNPPPATGVPATGKLIPPPTGVRLSPPAAGKSNPPPATGVPATGKLIPPPTGVRLSPPAAGKSKSAVAGFRPSHATGQAIPPPAASQVIAQPNSTAPVDTEIPLNACLMASFGGFDQYTVSVLEDFFAMCMESMDESVTRGLSILSRGMRGAVESYKAVCDDLNAGDERLNHLLREKSMIEQMLDEVYTENVQLKVCCIFYIFDS